jgi:hypothetical protein
MAQETVGNFLCPAIFGDETRLRSVGTAEPIGVPQNVAVRQTTSEFRFDDIAGCELLAASLRIEATFTPRAQRSLPNSARALPCAICAAIFGDSCASHARYPAMMSP